MTITIRPMQQTDLDKVYAIEQLSHLTPWSREVLTNCVLVGYDCRVLEHSTSGQIMGYIICRYSFNLCHILNLCVAPAEQRKGYGEQLLKSVLDSLPNNSAINTVILEARPSNFAAIALYEKYGFQKHGIKKEYYSDHHGIEDAILLKKDCAG